MVMIIIKLIFFNKYDNNTIGAIFCHVIRIIVVIQLNPSTISGNQKWNGAAPIFIMRVEFITIIMYLLIFIIISFIIFVEIITIIIENMKIDEDIAWTRKYFIIDSEDINLL